MSLHICKRILSALLSCKACREYRASLREAVQILSTVPSIDCVLLGYGQSNQGQDLAGLRIAACLQTHLASWQESM